MTAEVQTDQDLQPEAGAAVLTPLSVDQVVAGIEKVSTLPHIALKVIEVANDPNSGAAQLREVLEGDASLSTRVLKTTNSAACGLATKITNLQQAIAYLGINQIRNLAVTASVSQTFKDDRAIGTYRRRELWRHLVSVGICARLLAVRMKMQTFEEIYLAGLLHDLGIILIDQHVHGHFTQVVESLDEETPLCEQEREVLGFDHTTLASRIAEKWRFPETVRASMRFHHMSERCKGEIARGVQCVEVANFLCSIKGITSVGINLVQVPQVAVGSLELSKDDLKVLLADLDDEIKKSESLFHI
jgi:HD-like signal output (HDOD) protein